MRRGLLGLLLAACGLCACKSEAVELERNGLPAFAGSLRVETQLSSSELSRAVHLALSESGYVSHGRLLIVTDVALLGDVSARITARIDGSTVTASSRFAQGDLEPAEWRVARNASGPGERAFLSMQAALRNLPHERLVYLFED